MTTLPADTATTSFVFPRALPLAKLSIQQYDLMIEAGVFEPEDQRQRVELIEGVLLMMSPIGHQHENAVDWLTRWSIENTQADEVRVRIQESLTLPGQSTVPEPDIAWVRSGAYEQSRPAANEVLLVIEVAKSSVAYDLGKKADLYADAEIADYWVANIETQSLIVHRDPAKGRYANITTLQDEQSISPLAKSEACLTVASLFASE